MVEDKQLLQKKSFAFAVRIVNLYKYLVEQKSEYVISKQILRSGTSIGANLREAKRAQSTPDFHTKLTIALKEADETAYWLELLYETKFIDKKMYDSIQTDCEEIIKLLASITKTTRKQISTKS